VTAKMNPNATAMECAALALDALLKTP
jgi:hypothetical protein